MMIMKNQNPKYKVGYRFKFGKKISVIAAVKLDLKTNQYIYEFHDQVCSWYEHQLKEENCLSLEKKSRLSLIDERLVRLYS